MARSRRPSCHVEVGEGERGSDAHARGEVTPSDVTRGCLYIFEKTASGLMASLMASCTSLSSKYASQSPGMSANAGSTASLLLLLQLGSRLITFTLNQALLSFTTPAAFGTATIQLEPLLNTVLFLCREGIRATLARSSSARVSRKAVYRTSLLPLAFGIPLACAAFALYARSTAHAVAAQPHFRSSVLLYALATLVELASEPYFNRAQMAADVRLRVGIEGSAVIVRAVTTLLVILYGRDKLALLAFAIGQAAYSATLLIRYAWHYRHAQPAQSTDSSE